MKKSQPGSGASKKYVGIQNDLYGGMTATGTIIKDAWVFGILDESQTCENWNLGQIQDLYNKVYEAWEQYGHLVSLLPEDLKQRHQKINDAAIKRARELGWDPELSDND